MALGSAYGIEKYSDPERTKVNKDYARYTTIRTAIMFGYQIERVSNDRIILYNMMLKPAATGVIDKNYPYAVFEHDMQVLTESYNQLLKNYGKDVLPNDYYGQETSIQDDKLEKAYPYAQDPILKYVLLRNKMPANKADKFDKNVYEQMQHSVAVLKEVTWGKDIAAALEYFWHAQRDLLPKDPANSRPMEDPTKPGRPRDGQRAGGPEDPHIPPPTSARPVPMPKIGPENEVDIDPGIWLYGGNENVDPGIELKEPQRG